MTRNGYNLAAMLTERIWERIKQTAERNAAERRRLSREDSESVVNRIVLSVDGPFPQEAISFYARELIRLTDEAVAQHEALKWVRPTTSQTSPPIGDRT